MLITFIIPVWSQSWANPSFEGAPQEAFIPVGWSPCSSATTPDIFPGVWGVNRDPAEGSSFVGLITRSDGSNESIGQRVPIKLEKGKCYSISFYLATSDSYAGFNEPIKCRMWLGQNSCRPQQLIFESELLEDPAWMKRTIRFFPEESYEYLIIEAGFPSRSRKARGNILVDGLSMITPCDQT